VVVHDLPTGAVDHSRNSWTTLTASGQRSFKNPRKAAYRSRPPRPAPTSLR